MLRNFARIGNVLKNASKATNNISKFKSTYSIIQQQQPKAQFQQRSISISLRQNKNTNLISNVIEKQPNKQFKKLFSTNETKIQPPTPSYPQLSQSQKDLVDLEISILQSFRLELEKLHASKEDIDLLSRGLAQLEDLFLLVVVGEFNSGKSSFLNALLGKRFLKEGVTPTTSKINLLRHGEKFTITNQDTEHDVVSVPVDWLKEVTLVDTPGTNAVLKQHQKITEDFVPRSDLVLFVTSVDRAFSESERQFLTLIKQWRKKVVVVLSKVDVLETNDQLAEIVDFIVRHFKDLLGMEPLIFGVSSKLALSSKVASLDAEALEANPQWLKSGFSQLEGYIRQTLGRVERTKLKLENPVGVAEFLLSKYSEGLTSRLHLLRSDLETLQMIDEQLQQFRKDMLKELSFQKDHIDNGLLLMLNRGISFIDNNVAITNILSMMSKEKFQKSFELDVVGDTPRTIEKQTSDTIDWLLSKTARLWKDITGYIKDKPSIASGKLMGQITLDFDYNRSSLLQSIGQSATTVVNSFDKHSEADRLAEEIRRALLSTAAIEVGAIGIGTVLTITLLDLTGVLSFGALAVGGLAVLPYKRREMKAALQTKLDTLRVTLKKTLQDHFERELESAIKNLQSSIDPYSRFVKAESTRLAEAEQKFQNTLKQLQDLRVKIESEFPTKSIETGKQ